MIDSQWMVRFNPWQFSYLLHQLGIPPATFPTMAPQKTAILSVYNVSDLFKLLLPFFHAFKTSKARLRRRAWDFAPGICLITWKIFNKGDTDSGMLQKTGLLDLAKGLIKNDIRLLASGGTAKLIREGGFHALWVERKYPHEIHVLRIFTWQRYLWDHKKSWAPWGEGQDTTSRSVFLEVIPPCLPNW